MAMLNDFKPRRIKPLTMLDEFNETIKSFCYTEVPPVEELISILHMVNTCKTAAFKLY